MNNNGVVGNGLFSGGVGAVGGAGIGHIHSGAGIGHIQSGAAGNFLFIQSMWLQVLMLEKLFIQDTRLWEMLFLKLTLLQNQNEHKRVIPYFYHHIFFPDIKKYFSTALRI